MEISQKQLMMCHKLKTYCWYLMVVLCAILDFIDSLQAKNCAGATHWPISQWGVQYIQSWGHWGHISDLRWIFWAPNRREHTISASVPSSEIDFKQTFLKCCEGKKNGSAAEYSLLVYYTVLLESLQKLAPWRMLRSSRMQWLHVRQSSMGSLSQRDSKTDVFAEFPIFFWSLSTTNKGNHMPKI